MTKEIQEILDSVSLNTEFRSHNIPSIDLYMDQIIGLINSAFAADGGDEKEKQLTKTMIHNYSKEGLIKPVKGKKYNKEHILQMLMVYQLKNTIKISDIKDMLKEIYRSDGYDESFLDRCFDRHMEHREHIQKDIGVYLDGLINQQGLSCHTEEDCLVLLLDLAAVSYYFRCLTEKLACFMSKKED